MTKPVLLVGLPISSRHLLFISLCVPAFCFIEFPNTKVVQGGTYGGSILGCAAANATIDAIEEDGMLDNAKERGVQLIKVNLTVQPNLLE